MWGDDYPHLEGTYGHTQETLHQLFDSVDPRIKQRVLRGTFEELFTVRRSRPTRASESHRSQVAPADARAGHADR